MLVLLAESSIAQTAPRLTQAQFIIGFESEGGLPLKRALQGSRQLGKKQQLTATQAELIGPLQQPPRPVLEAVAPKPIDAYVLTASDSVQANALMERWRGRSGVAFVQRNHVYEVDRGETPPDDPPGGKAHWRKPIRVDEAWGVTTGDPGVTIGFTDTGLFFDHPEFAGQVRVNDGEDLNGNGRVDASDFNDVDDDGNGYVDDLHGYDFVDRPSAYAKGDYARRDPDPSLDLDPPSGLAPTNSHGTLVAGILAAANGEGADFAGVAPGAKLLPLRTHAADGLGTDADIAAAIVYAADNDVDVLNMSFGGPQYSPLLKAAVAYAHEQGVILVGSAGNTQGDDPHYPSDYEEVISVAKLSNAGEIPVSRGSYGSGLDLGAPGSDIFTTFYAPPDPDGDLSEEDRLYKRESGSSFSAPMVAGAAALLRSTEPSLDPSDARGVLTATARDIGPEGWDYSSGAGRLNVAEAVMDGLPGRTAIIAPDEDDGFASGPVAIVGSSVHPSAVSYAVYYAPGSGDLNDARWTQIGPSHERRVYQDTLAVWDVSALPDTAYTLRLVTQLAGGRNSIEDRRRVYLDRTPPRFEVHLLGAGLAGANHAVIADVETNDLTGLRMHVRLNGRTGEAKSTVRARRHGVTWIDRSGAGGRASVELVATNAAGLSSTYRADVQLPRNQFRRSLFEDEQLAVPAGWPLSEATDFDGDGLREVTISTGTEAPGSLGDTLAVYEWNGTEEGFQPAHRQRVRVRVPASDTTDGVPDSSGAIPRDVRDIDGDGQRELLTQVQLGLILFEQNAGPDPYPFQKTFARSEGYAGNAVTGARLTDLDDDGRAEIFAQNVDQWLILERRDGRFEVVSELENPTSAHVEPVVQSRLSGGEGNEATTTLAAVGDFDGDGRLAALVGDNDGDLVLFEAQGDDAFKATWTHETERYEAGARLATGDFDGDGQPEFVTYDESWPFAKHERDTLRREPPVEVEPSIGTYSMWDASGNDQFEREWMLPIRGGISLPGALRAADFDGDGRAEVAVLHPPNLYVLDRSDDNGWTAVYHRSVTNPAVPDGMVGPAMTAGDFDDNGAADLLVGSADGHLHRFTYQQSVAARPDAPQLTAAHALSDSSVVLRWRRALGADSVVVYATVPGEDLDPAAATSADTLRLTTRKARYYALRAYRGGEPSPFSRRYGIRPHAPAVVREITYPDSASARIVFSEPLARTTRADQFVLVDSVRPDALLLGHGEQAAILRFPHRALGGQSAALRWKGVTDAEGTPVAEQQAVLQFPAPGGGALIVSDWTITGPREVALTFNKPLDPKSTRALGHYRIEPVGKVVDATLSESAPRVVTLRVDGRVLGANGLEAVLHLSDLHSAGGGARLAEASRAVRLVEFAESLAGAHVFPNPYRAGRQRERVTIAGLPAEATLRIISADGHLVRVLKERDGDGGRSWNLRDEQGRLVPAGVYFVRVKAGDVNPVMRKFAIIR